MLAEPTEIAAGSKFRYSNSNTQLLVAVVEVVSGTTYPNYVRRELWAPVRLRDTGFAGTSGAEKVIPVRGKLPPMLQRAYWGGQGVYSSASDLLQWYRALPTEKILGKVHAAAMFAPVVTIGEGTAGLGWFTGKTARGSEYHFVRGNEDVGANALLYSYPAQSIVIIVLTHEGNADENTSWSRKVLHSLENQLML